MLIVTETKPKQRTKNKEQGTTNQVKEQGTRNPKP
jgi:hypothetical protein